MEKSKVVINDGIIEEISLNQNDTEELNELGFCTIEIDGDLHFIIKDQCDNFYVAKVIENWSRIKTYR